MRDTDFLNFLPARSLLIIILFFNIFGILENWNHEKANRQHNLIELGI